MLFSEDGIHLNLENADISYYPTFFNATEANYYFKNLLKTIAWQQDTITVFGKTHLQPRLTALYAENSKPYSYSGITMHPKPFTKSLIEIKSKIETQLETSFTTCLCNLYRHGQDSNGWHADNEKELGKNPIIASISFGAERAFHLKHKTNLKLKQKLMLRHGSLLVMKGTTQDYWLHQIAKTKKDVGQRINLTYRILH